MSYKVIKNDSKHYQIMHPDGTKFIVPKKGINPEMQKKIDGLPKYFGGGEPSDTQLNQPETLSQSPQVSSYEPQLYNKADDRSFADQISSVQSPSSYQNPSIPGVDDQHWLSGVNGASGAPGVPGVEGVSGAPGVPGVEGVSGVPGIQGSTGAQGIQPTASYDSSKPKENLNDILNSVTMNKSSAEVPSENMQPKPEDPMAGFNKVMDQASRNSMAGYEQSKKSTDDFNRNIDAGLVKQHNIAEQFNTAAKKATDDLEKVGQEKIDAGHFWGNLSTGNKILAGVSMALGGIGAGLSGRPNAAMEIINKNIENDIMAQKENKSSMYNIALQKFKNVEMATNAARLAALSQTEAETKKLMANTNNAQMLQNANNFKNGIDMQREQLAMQMKMMMQKQFINGKLYQGGVPTDQMPVELRADPKQAQQMVDVDGMTYMHKGNPDSAQQMRDYESAVGPIKNGIALLSTLNPLNPSDRQKADSIRAGLATSVAGLKSLKIGSKRVNEVEADRALEQMSNPNHFYESFVGKNVRNNEFINALNDETESIRKQNYWGYHPLGFKPTMGMK